VTKHWTDRDGDQNLSIEVGDLTVFATEQVSGRWTVNFALTTQIYGADWMETMTGRGAFATIRAIRPAVEALLAEITLRGSDWLVCCDRRRARLYSRYIPTDRIQITE
jgi:hypothetical protein